MGPTPRPAVRGTRALRGNPFASTTIRSPMRRRFTTGALSCRRSVQRREPQAAFFVAGEEIEPVRVATFVQDDRLRLLELFARDGRGGDLVHALFLHVA